MPELPEVYPTVLDPIPPPVIPPPAAAPTAWQDGATFRECFLLYVEHEPLNRMLRAVGRALFDHVLNAHGWPDWPEGAAVAELRAAVADLRHLESYLAGIGREPEEAPLTEAETVLSRLAARQARELARIGAEIEAALDVAAGKGVA